MPYCQNCGNSFLPGDIKCTKCGINLEEAVNQKIIGKKIYNFSNPVLRRAIAALIDYSIVIGAILFFIFFKRRALPFLLIRRVLAIIIAPLYFLLKDSLFGKSIGKLFGGIMVFNEKENKRGSILDSIIRNWYLVIPVVGPTIFAVIMAVQLISGKRQRMGDKAASTIVIKKVEYNNFV